MLHSAVGIIREMKLKDNGSGTYTVDFKDPDGNVHSTKSWVMKEMKYDEGDSISIRYHSFHIFGRSVIITTKIDDVNQNNDKFAISGAGAAALIAGGAAAIIITHFIRRRLEKEKENA